MPHSVKLTNDQGERLAARNRLLDRISQASEASAQEPVVEVFLRLIPSNYEDLNEFELFKVLTGTSELAHTRDMAVETIEILLNKKENPGNILFQRVEIQPVEPEVVVERKLQEPDPTTMISEKANRKNFKDRLASRIEYSIVNQVKPSNPVEIIEKYAGGFNKVGVDVEPLEMMIPDYSNVNPKILRDDADKRRDFKRGLLSKVERDSKPVVHQEVRDLIIPEDFRSMRPINLARIIAQDNKLSSEEANDIVFELLKPEPVETVVTDVQPVQVDVRIPVGFDNMKTIDKKWFLTTEGQLSSDLADEYLAFIEGKPVRGNYVFNVAVVDVKHPVVEESSPETLTVDIEDLVTSVAVPFNYAELSEYELHFTLVHDEVFATSNEKALDAINYLYGRPTSKSVLMITPDGEEVKPLESIVETVEPQKPVLSTVMLQVPAGFNQFKPAVKFQFLQSVRNLTPDEAHAALEGKPFNNKSFVFEYQAPETETLNPISEYLGNRDDIRAKLADRIASSVREPKAVPEFKAPEAPARQKRFVSVPAFVKGLTPNQMYLYLASERQWLPEEANEFVAFMSGKPTSIDFEVEFEG